MLCSLNNHNPFLDSGSKVLFKENFQRMLSEAMAELRHKGCAENNSWDRKSHARKEVCDYMMTLV